MAFRVLSAAGVRVSDSIGVDDSVDVLRRHAPIGVVFRQVESTATAYDPPGGRIPGAVQSRANELQSNGLWL